MGKNSQGDVSTKVGFGNPWHGLGDGNYNGKSFVDYSFVALSSAAHYSYTESVLRFVGFQLKGNKRLVRSTISVSAAVFFCLLDVRNKRNDAL